MYNLGQVPGVLLHLPTFEVGIFALYVCVGGGWEELMLEVERLYQYIYTIVLAVCCVAIHCLHILCAEQLSLNPPRTRLPRLSAEMAAIVP